MTVRDIQSMWKTRVVSSCLVSFFLGVSSAAYAGAPSEWGAAGDTIKINDLVPRLYDSEGYGEKYTFVAQIKTEADEATGQGEQTGRFYFSLSISNLGGGDHKLEAKGALELGEKSFKWKVKRQKGKWRSAKGKLDIKAGGVHLSGTVEQLVFNVQNGDETLEIKFKPIVETWRPTGGGLQLGDGNNAEFSLFPLAEIAGQLKNKNGDLNELRGHGWGRHTWSQLGPHEWSLWNIQLRVFDPAHKRALFIRRLRTGEDYSKSERSYGLLIEDGKRVFEGYMLSLEQKKSYRDKKHDNQYSFPTDFVLTGVDVKSGARFRGQFETGKRHYRRNPIQNLPWIKRKAVELVTKPMEYAYELKYEISLSGTTSLSIKGEDGRYEAYFFN